MQFDDDLVQLDDVPYGQNGWLNPTPPSIISFTNRIGDELYNSIPKCFREFLLYCFCGRDGRRLDMDARTCGNIQPANVI